MVGKDLGCGKVFQVLMICDHVDRSTGTFKEVSLTSRRSLKMSFMKRWKVAGALVSPEGITSHSKEP